MCLSVVRHVPAASASATSLPAATGKLRGLRGMGSEGRIEFDEVSILATAAGLRGEVLFGRLGKDLGDAAARFTLVFVEGHRVEGFLEPISEFPPSRASLPGRNRIATLNKLILR